MVLHSTERLGKQGHASRAVLPRVASERECLVQPICDEISRRCGEEVSKLATVAGRVVLVRHDNADSRGTRLTQLLCQQLTLSLQI